MPNHELPIGWKKAGVIIQCLSLIAIVLAVLALYQQRRALKDQHEWNRRHYTVQMLGECNSQICPFQKSLKQVAPGIFSKNASSPISPEYVEKLINADPNSYYGKIRQDLVGFHNYMEYVCIAYEANVVDRDRVKEFYSYSFIRAYDNLKNLFERFEREQHNQSHVCPIKRVITKWNSEYAPIVDSPRTGER